MRLAALTIAVLSLLAAPASSAEVAPPWTARWISVPGAPAFDYGVYHFRRAFELGERPATFLVHVTADNRYQLFVNGERVSWGPARGDLYHWRYETVDLAPHLRAGRNVLAAVVWNFGVHAPQAQVTHQTGFLLQVAAEAGKAVSTDRSWKAVRDEAYAPVPIVPAEIHNAYYVAGPGDRVDAAVYPWGWEQPDFDDSKWEAAQQGPVGSARDAIDAPSRWMLVPRSIPAMEEVPTRFARMRRASGVTPPAAFPRTPARFVIPARAKATVLLDQDQLTTAYPELTVSGGRGATLTLRYAEALLEPGRKVKGNRDDVEGKELRGARDVFVADGGARRRFRPLWWRTYRYVQLEVETMDEPVTVEDLAAVATSYPFTARARLDTGAPELDRILDVGWRTARLCAHESYMDCPYYEQLQYAGDTRIQALVSLYMTGDARLVRNAIAQLDDSRTSEGLTQSRAPTRLQQYIPPFSLWWVGMLHDYWRYQDDPDFVRRMLPGVRSVLMFFADRQTADGTLGRLPWWNFVDWARAWPRGIPPSLDGASAPLDLQLLLAYGYAADLEQAVGSAGPRDRAARSVRTPAGDDPGPLLGCRAWPLRGHAGAHAVLAARERARGAGRCRRGPGGAGGHGPRALRHVARAVLDLLPPLPARRAQSHRPGRPVSRAARPLAPDAGGGPHDVGRDQRARRALGLPRLGREPELRAVSDRPRDRLRRAGLPTCGHPAVPGPSHAGERRDPSPAGRDRGEPGPDRRAARRGHPPAGGSRGRVRPWRHAAPASLGSLAAHPARPEPLTKHPPARADQGCPTAFASVT